MSKKRKKSRRLTERQVAYWKAARSISEFFLPMYPELSGTGVLPPDCIALLIRKHYPDFARRPEGARELVARFYKWAWALKNNQLPPIPRLNLEPKVKAKPKKKKKYRSGFYLSEDWRAVRYEALKRNGGKCDLCGRGKHDGVTLHVDHIKPRSKHPELALMLWNLQVLCEDCNLGKSNRDDTDWRAPNVVRLVSGQ